MNKPLGPDLLMVVRAKGGNLLNFKEWEKREKGKWVPCTREEIEKWLDQRKHVLWNPVGHVQYGEKRNEN